SDLNSRCLSGIPRPAAEEASGSVSSPSTRRCVKARGTTSNRGSQRLSTTASASGGAGLVRTPSRRPGPEQGAPAAANVGSSRTWDVIVSPGSLSNEGLGHETGHACQGDCTVEQQPEPHRRPVSSGWKIDDVNENQDGGNRPEDRITAPIASAHIEAE